jgi:CubicO group peptidase (beta-lactamase class C family)
MSSAFNDEKLVLINYNKSYSMRKLVFFIFLPLFSFSQSNYVPFLDSFMQTQVAVRKFNGNILIARSGNILYQKAFGYRNYETRELLDNNSVFELGSVSKQFTAMGILLLKEQGKLQLSDSLRKFFPELPYYNITIRHLLTHTSGLPDYETTMNSKWDHKKIAFNPDMIRFLSIEKPPILFLPGDKWTYSNTGYALLASIIEKVSGKSFHDFMQQSVFKPLGMNHTRIYNTRRSSKEVISNYAYGYVYSDSLKRFILPDSLPKYDIVIFLDGIQGDGVVNSTTGDLLKWDRALKNHKLLAETTQREMLSSQAITDTATKAGYGYGVLVGKNKFGTTLYHSGSWPGYITMLHRNVEDDLTIIVLSNNSTNSSTLANQLSYILHNEPVEFPYTHKEITIDTLILKRYLGKYQGTSLIDLIIDSGKLFRKGNGTIELKPESATRFFYADGTDRQIEFVVDANGKPEKVWFIQNGIKTELKKVE